MMFIKMLENVKLRFNYTISKVENDIIPFILCEHYGLNITSENVNRFVDKNGQILKRFEKDICKALKNYRGNYRQLVTVERGHNIVPNVLRYTLAQNIAGDTVTPTYKADRIALGDDSTAAANTDTALGNELLRQTFSSRSSLDNVAYLDKYFSNTDVGGNSYLEVGIFVDNLFLLSRKIINQSLSATETLTINATITIS